MAYKAETVATMMAPHDMYGTDLTTAAGMTPWNEELAADMSMCSTISSNESCDPFSNHSSFFHASPHPHAAYVATSHAPHDLPSPPSPPMEDHSPELAHKTHKNSLSMFIASKPRDALQLWTKDELITRVGMLEQLLQQRYSELPKQECWPCRWASCDTMTYSMSQLTEHLCRAHVGKGRAMYYCRWAGCPRHDKPFTKRHKMHNHLRTHTGERPFVCEFGGCGKRFSRPDSLSTHRKTHSNIRPFACQECKKSYFHARSLRKHMKASMHVSSVERLA
ncbi:hypothetical protein BC940DRAFT_299689 [Gongronella butleri]|nr:hypothetical protein BC940DRAFT_299689 [Gongronella butleri]